MALPILVIGDSGSGKSASLRNFSRGQIGVFSVASKPLPFRNDLSVIRHATYGEIYAHFKQAAQTGRYFPVYAIDDSQYLMAFSAFDKAKDAGYGKFTDMAVDFYNLLKFVIEGLPDEITVYFLHHSEQNDMGKIKAKTLGKMIDNQLTLEGLFSIVLLCQTDGQRHWFTTQSDGFTTAKSPMDMFDREIDNDLKMVDTTIRDYYGMHPLKEPKRTTKTTAEETNTTADADEKESA